MIQVGESVECADFANINVVSFTKPTNFDALVDSYYEYFKKSDCGFTELKTKFKYTQEEEEDPVAAEDPLNSSNPLEQLNEVEVEVNNNVANDDRNTNTVEGMWHLLKTNRYGKEKKAKLTILKSAENIFLKFAGFPVNSENKIVRDERTRISTHDKIYTVNMTKYNAQIKNSARFPMITINIPGGIVVPNKIPVFNKTKTADGDYNVLSTCDYTSLYPSTMDFMNICTSVAATNPEFAVRINDRLYNPFDKSVMNQIAAPLKVNDSYIAVPVFLIKSIVKKSVNSIVIEGVMKLRAQVKKELALAKAAGNLAEAARLEVYQNALKLIINTMYGIYLKTGYCTYRPELASLVTYYGRMALIRFFLCFHKYIAEANIPLVGKGILGGDTDSLFISATLKEIKDTINQFCSMDIHRNKYEIKLEATLDSGIFLGKKNYIMYKRNGENKEYIMKSTIKRNQCTPCKALCERILDSIFTHILAEEVDYEKFQSTITDAFHLFNSEPDELFRHRFKMSKDLNDYKNSSAIIKQLKSLNRPFLIGSEIRYAHFPYIFDEGPCYGPVDGTSYEQQRYLNKYHLATVLVDDLYQIKYKEMFQEKNICVWKARSYALDLKAVVEKILLAFSKSSVPGGTHVAEYYQECFRKVFGETKVLAAPPRTKRSLALNVNIDQTIDRVVEEARGYTDQNFEKFAAAKIRRIDSFLVSNRKNK